MLISISFSLYLRSRSPAANTYRLLTLVLSLVPKLMYGFGDDKHVSNDSVAVMEEILIEYIVDVVRVYPLSMLLYLA